MLRRYLDCVRLVRWDFRLSRLSNAGASGGCRRKCNRESARRVKARREKQMNEMKEAVSPHVHP